MILRHIRLAGPAKVDSMLAHKLNFRGLLQNIDLCTINAGHPVNALHPGRVCKHVFQMISGKFLEFDTHTMLIVLNQDDASYTDITLAKGGIAAIVSTSSNLDPDLPLREQLNYVPVGIQLVLEGRRTDWDTFVLFNFTKYCGLTALKTGNHIGWRTLNGLVTAAVKLRRSRKRKCCPS